MIEKTLSKKPIDFSGLGGKLVLPPPAANPAGNAAKVDMSDLYGEKGGQISHAPSPEKSATEPDEAESVASLDDEASE